MHVGEIPPSVIARERTRATRRPPWHREACALYSSSLCLQFPSGWESPRPESVLTTVEDFSNSQCSVPLCRCLSAIATVARAYSY